MPTAKIHAIKMPTKTVAIIMKTYAVISPAAPLPIAATQSILSPIRKVAYRKIINTNTGKRVLK